MCNRYLDKNREGLPKDTRLDEMKAERKKTTSLYLKKRLEDPLLLYNICWSNNEDRLEPMIAYVRTTQLFFFLLDESSDCHQTFGPHVTVLEKRLSVRPLFLYSKCWRDRLAA